RGGDGGGGGPAEAVRADGGAGRDDFQRPTRDGHRLRRPERGREIHYDAGNPRLGCGRRWHRRDRRATVLEPAAPADPRRLAAGRQSAAAEPHCPQPPPLPAPLPNPPHAPPCPTSTPPRP